MKGFVNACFLHDIGKIILRSKEGHSGKNHSEEGAKWLSKRLSEIGRDSLNKIIYLVELHHNLKEAEEIPLLALLQKADHLAAGERETSKGKCTGPYKWDWYAPLATPFSRISLKNPRPQDPYPAFWPLEEVSPDLPSAAKCPSRTTPEKYAELLENFEKNFLEIAKNGDLSPNKLLVILEKYFSFVPSETCVPKEGYKDWPDISLFDHLKLTAAIGSVYYLWLEEKYGPDFIKHQFVIEELSNRNQQPFILVGGDLSGVQNFIYTISSKGALLSLKGRSFFLELLMEHTINRILSEAGLYRCNVIFSGGGHFYLLLPNTKSAEGILETTKRKINDWLWRKFEALLELHIVWEPFGEEVFISQKKGIRAGDIFAKVSEKLEKSKKKPFSEQLSSMFEPISIHPSCLEAEGAPGACEVCFRDEVNISNRSDDVNLILCDACYDEYRLGKNIQQQSGKNKNLFSSYLNINNHGVITIENKGYEFDSKPQDDTYFAVNHFSPGAEAFLPCGYYQGIWEFEKIKEEGFGLPRLSALRMDVDNLGRIFKEGLLPEDQTFSRISAISRSLNLFFKYYLNTLLCGRNHLPGYKPPERFNWAKRDIDQDGRKVAIIYSGGDDLFIMGAWLDVCEAAIDIVKAFSSYTGNPELTLSGGIALGPIKMPVYQFARLAGAGEDKAKDLRPKKNALFILGEVIPNESLINLKEMLNFWQKYLEPDTQKASLILKEPFSKAFLYRILNIAQELTREDDKKDKAIFLPRIAYLLSRLDREKLKKDYLTLQNWLLSLDFEKNWKLMHVAMQWIIMSMRREDNE
ncbi:type III-A CRISPR-associated protein Cas10/Csm1 [Thermosulfurimonas dismutans]|uniref:CRISPR system single-strand-specific deoxyribonuclease Cas10/Csm1 (subtype III-A) n=1 Tax=Thermosulfurimonas dismutans TaxID=999894 RepID=A0A179D2K0_9BACT|nr:type III-A CRISPR-associated protein Cas10/Csm1 [Thermosulfurimonas dismutans]OAQ20021.1 CRISPR-associated protein, Csm1 family [Thermosulfurimonas dismutans]